MSDQNKNPLAQEIPVDASEKSHRLRGFLGDVAITAALGGAVYGVYGAASEALHSGLPNYIALPAAVAVGAGARLVASRRE